MFKKLVLGKNKKGYLVTLEMQIKQKECVNNSTLKKETMNTLSICGEGRYISHQDCNYAGQIYDTISENFNTKKSKRIVKLWKRWHLNDLKPGTVKQCDYVRALRESGEIPEGFQYDLECEKLLAAGLYDDCGIVWGRQWMCEVLPEDIISELVDLFST